MKRFMVLVLLLLLISAPAMGKTVKFKIPKQGWSISFDTPPLSKKQKVTRDGDYMFKANSGRFNLSLFVEKPHETNSSHEDCYNYYWPKASKNPMIDQETISKIDTDKYVRVQYDIVTKFNDQSIQMKNVNYYFSYRERWIDVHISIIAPNSDDEKIFITFDNSLAYGE